MNLNTDITMIFSSQCTFIVLIFSINKKKNDDLRQGIPWTVFEIIKKMSNFVDQPVDISRGHAFKITV